MWSKVGKALEELNVRGRGVALHAPPGVSRAPWLSEIEASSWRVTFMVGADGYSAIGPTPLAAVEEALGLCPVKDGIGR